jgi:hypothetical protein
LTLLKEMEEFVSRSEHSRAIDYACNECEKELQNRPGLEMTWRAVLPQLELTGSMKAVHSLWVFAFAPSAESDTHRHSNSTQYTRSWRGSGVLRIGNPDSAVEVQLPPPEGEGPQREQWSIIPSGIFHRAIASEHGWCVVSFQTAPADELQDEPFEGPSSHYIKTSL